MAKDARGHGSEKRGTPLTRRWRVIARGADRYFADPARPANAKATAAYNTPERWARRRAATNPANRDLCQFDAQGNLTNFRDLPEGKAFYGRS
jgi:hypothetical protein